MRQYAKRATRQGAAICIITSPPAPSAAYFDIRIRPLREYQPLRQQHQAVRSQVPSSLQ
jgi:hypothetical protein